MRGPVRGRRRLRKLQKLTRIARTPVCRIQGPKGVCIRAMPFTAALEEVARRDRGHLCWRPRLGVPRRPNALRFLLLDVPQARHICALRSHQRGLVEDRYVLTFSCLSRARFVALGAIDTVGGKLVNTTPLAAGLSSQ